MRGKFGSLAKVVRFALAPLAVLLAVTLFAQIGSSSLAEASAKVVVNKVYFEGNRKAKDGQLESMVQTTAGRPYDAATTARDVELLREVYARSAGRAAATISVRAVPINANSVDVVFTIAEGDKIGIDQIVFVGNNAFSDWRLKRQMETLESGFLGWFRTTDVYDPDRVQRDTEALRRFYNKRGYPDFRVVSAVAALNAAGSGFVVTITVDEGEYYQFGKGTVESAIPEVQADTLLGEIRTSPGETYNSEEVDKTVEAMTTELSARGFPFAQVRPRGERDAAGKQVGVTYVVEDGARVYIERINIRGNTRTRDYVIRREFDLAEGDAYNQALVDRAARRLRNLAYFDRVTVTNEPGSTPDRVVINVDVEDKATGEFSVGGGYSTSDGFVGDVSFTERNFLGRGQFVKVSGKWGEKSTGLALSFTEPYFMGERIAAGFDLYANSADSNDYSYYSTNQTGATLRATLPITDNFSFGVRYTGLVKEVKIDNAVYNDCTFANVGTDASPANGKPDCVDNGEASNAFKEILGTRFLSMVGYTLTYSTLDDGREPTSGIYAQFNQDIAGLGGDSFFIKSTAQGRYYYPLMDDLTAMIKVQGGHIASLDGDLKVSDHFTIGPDLVRGFSPGGIGPRDGTGKGNGLGGSIYYGATAELQFPLLGLPRELGLRGALFADAGTLYNYEGKTVYTCVGASDDICPGGAIALNDTNVLRSSVGASLLWASPLGPIRFDYAYVLNKASYDQEQAFRFSGGTSF